MTKNFLFLFKQVGTLYNVRAREGMYKWRENNIEKYRDICRKGQAKYRENNEERIRLYKKEYYLRKKQEKL